MNLLGLLDSVGGQQSLGNIGSNLELDASKTNDLVGALAPSPYGCPEETDKFTGWS